MAGAFFEDVYDWWEYGDYLIGDSQGTVAWAAANDEACAIADPAVVACPLDPTSYLLLQQVQQQGEAARLLRRGELRPDRQVVDHRRRALVRVRSRDVRPVPDSVRPPGQQRSGCQRSPQQGHRQRHVVQVRDRISLHARRHGVCALQRGLPPRRTEFAARGRDGRGAAQLRTGPPRQLRGRASRASGSTTGCCSTLSAVPTWSGTTSRSTSAAPMATTTVRSGSRATSTAARPSRQGIEFNGQWYATERLNFSVERLSREPGVHRRHARPELGRGLHRGGLDAAGLAEGKVLGVGRVHLPGLPAACGRLVDSVLVHVQGETWDSLSEIEDFHSEDPAVREAALEFRLPEWKSGTFQLGYTSDNGWDTALIVRNVFDDSGVNWMSGTDRGAAFGDPRWRYVRGAAAAAKLRALVHQEMVTVVRLNGLTVEARHDLGGARQPPGREPWRRLPDRPRRRARSRRRSTGTRPASTGRAAAGTAACAASRSTATSSTSRRATSSSPTRRNFRLIGSWRNPYLKHCHEIAVWERTPVPGVDRLRLASSASTSTARNSPGRCTWSPNSSVSRVGTSTRARTTGPLMLNKLHLNNVHCTKGGMYMSGLQDRRHAAVQRPRGPDGGRAAAGHAQRAALPRRRPVQRHRGERAALRGARRRARRPGDARAALSRRRAPEPRDGPEPASRARGSRAASPCSRRRWSQAAPRRPRSRSTTSRATSACSPST